MTETSSSAYDLQCTDVLMHLAVDVTNQQPGREHALAADAQLPDQASSVAQLQAELASTKAVLLEKERALLTEQRRVQELQEKLATCASPAATKAASNPFDMVLTLSSEREAALRERKVYKDRAANAEATVAQLESDLAAAHATAKVQAERAFKLAARSDELQRRVTALDSEKLACEHRLAQLAAQQAAPPDTVNGDDAVATLRRQLKERDNRIFELEMQLTDGAGAPTMFGGELERHTPGAFASVTYALESLDNPGEVHRLTHPVNTVGRNKANDISLDSASISRFHARLLTKPDGIWLIDLQSINGCQVNGQRTSSQVLNEGDIVVIGHCRFRFSALKPAHSS